MMGTVRCQWFFWRTGIKPWFEILTNERKIFPFSNKTLPYEKKRL